jgi:hypothetical protein
LSPAGSGLGPTTRAVLRPTTTRVITHPEKKRDREVRPRQRQREREREKERERKRERESEERERNKERKRDTEKERERQRERETKRGKECINAVIECSWITLRYLRYDLLLTNKNFAEELSINSTTALEQSNTNCGSYLTVGGRERPGIRERER